MAIITSTIEELKAKLTKEVEDFLIACNEKMGKLYKHKINRSIKKIKGNYEKIFVDGRVIERGINPFLGPTINVNLVAVQEIETPQKKNHITVFILVRGKQLYKDIKLEREYFKRSLNQNYSKVNINITNLEK